MSSYCNFNPKLFREFTSMKTKVKPELADDWELIPDTYNTRGGMILNMADDFEVDCPPEIKEKLVAEFNKCEDDYKSDFHILPNIAAAEHIATQLDKWAFIAQRTEVIDGWYAVWSIGD